MTPEVPPLVTERFPLASCRERWLALLGLEHATLPLPCDYAREGEELVVTRREAPGRLLADGRVPRGAGSQLLLQASAAAAFFASRGIPLAGPDLASARWSGRRMDFRLHLARSPWWIGHGGPATALSGLLAELVERLFASGGRVSAPGARRLREALLAPDAPHRRPEFWVASTLRHFPDLGSPAAGAARARVLGLCGEALRTPHERALLAKGRSLLSGESPRLFSPPASTLEPGGALGLQPVPRSAAEASRALRCSLPREGARAVWIAVEPERWDSLSRRAFEAARLALGGRVAAVVFSGEPVPLPPEADRWRAEVWVPCGTVVASVRVYEWLAEAARHGAVQPRDLVSRLLFSSAWVALATDPTGDAPLPPPEAWETLAPHPDAPGAPRRSPAPNGSAAEIEHLLDAGRIDEAVAAAGDWIGRGPVHAPEPWFPLVARLSAVIGHRFVPWLEALEAEREAVGGRVADAKRRLERLARSNAGSPEERRRSKLRVAEMCVRLDRPIEAARRAAAWRRDHSDAPPEEAVRALRLGALGLAREGRFECALLLLEEADRATEALPEHERIENALRRASVYALAGRFDEEDRLYQEIRARATGAGDDGLAARFLAQEARGLLDRRDFAGAALRLEEALAFARDEPGERAALLLDLAATVYHAGRSSECEARLAEAIGAAAAAGREDLGRVARSNRIELLVDRGAWGEAAAEVAWLERSAREGKDDARLVVALHHRSRLALRRGFLDAAARDGREARDLAERLGDRLEIGELWLEEGDRRAYEGDAEGAREAWERAAGAPPDRCDRDRRARQRLEELSWREQGGPPEAALEAVGELFGCDSLAAAEAVARWRGLLTAAAVPVELADRADRALREQGAGALADRVFGVRQAVTPEALRALRDAVAGALEGAAVPGVRSTLDRLGLEGLAVSDGEGREILRLGAPGQVPASAARRPLEAGGARFELRCWPSPSEAVPGAAALLLETMLFRAAPRPAGTDFAEGWRRLGLVTADAAMEEPYRRLVRFAAQPVTVLVLGESGSGKEAVARAVHRLSARAQGPFVPVNVAAIPAALLESELFGHVRGAFTGADRERRGLLEEAHGGTIFFDEVADLDLALQAKLLRALQEREVRRVGENRPRSLDLRIVSATSRDLSREVEAGRFREDLFYRLQVAVIRLPPLRERGRDALLLARHFLERFAREYGRGSLRLAPEAAAAILTHRWPGNVRELQSAIAQAAALGDEDAVVGAAQLPEAIRGARPAASSAGDYRTRVDAHRRDLIADALDRSGGNRTRAARELGLSRQALLYLIRELRVKDARRET